MRGGSDAFEYFEVYNAGDQAVNLDQYGFWYDNGSSVKQWILERQRPGAGKPMKHWWSGIRK